MKRQTAARHVASRDQTHTECHSERPETQERACGVWALRRDVTRGRGRHQKEMEKESRINYLYKNYAPRFYRSKCVVDNTIQCLSYSSSGRVSKSAAQANT